MAALAAISVLVAGASLVSFAESYRGLYLWAHEHGLHGVWAACWPLQVDVFIAVGELALFVALADGWSKRSRIGAWLVTLGGLAVSLAGNVGHVVTHTFDVRATAAVPPLAAASALAVGLGVLKRVVAAHHQAAESARIAALEGAPVTVPGTHLVPVPETVPGTLPSAPGTVLADRAQAHPLAVPETVLALNGQAHPEHAPDSPAGHTPGARPERTPGRAQARPVKRTGPVTEVDAVAVFADLLTKGDIPSLRAIRRELHVGTDRAREIHAHLKSVTTPT